MVSQLHPLDGRYQITTQQKKGITYNQVAITRGKANILSRKGNGNENQKSTMNSRSGGLFTRSQLKIVLMIHYSDINTKKV